MTYGINLNAQQASVIWNMCNAENKIISVERILQYSKLASEAALVIEDCRPPINWPSTGTICFRNLQVRYPHVIWDSRWTTLFDQLSCLFVADPIRGASPIRA